MKSNKGFTLIELLAVIVILAIIALIATPIILNMIENSRTSAKQRTAELIGSEVQLAYAEYMVTPNVSGVSPSDFCTYMQAPYFSMSGAEITSEPTDCTSAKTEVEVTVGTADKYDVVYSNGTVTITLQGEGNSDITASVKMKNAATTTPSTGDTTGDTSGN